MICYLVSKCKVMTFTLKSTYIKTNYTIDHSMLNRVSSSQDLGVFFNSTLKWDEHIDRTVNAASRNLGFLMRNTFEFKNYKPIQLLYNSLVRSKLEFASKVWNPGIALYQRKLETVQNKFLKYIYFKKNRRYPEYNEYHNIRCELEIFKLKDRREIASILFMHKLINNRVDCPMLLPLVKLYIPAFRCRPRNTFYVPFCRTNIRLNSSLITILTTTNSVLYNSDIDIFSTTITNFKKQIISVYKQNYNMD